MKFRIIELNNLYYPQVFKEDPAKWMTISTIMEEYRTLEDAEKAIKNFINSGEAKKLPIIVKELEYSNELVTRS